MIGCITQSFVELKLDDEAYKVAEKYENVHFNDCALSTMVPCASPIFLSIYSWSASKKLSR